MKQIDKQVICSQREEWYPKKKIEFLLVIQIAFPASISGHSPVSVTVITRCCLLHTSQSSSVLTVPHSSPQTPSLPLLPLFPPGIFPFAPRESPSSAFYTCCSPFFPNPFFKDHFRSWVFLGGGATIGHQSQKKHCIAGENFICNTVTEKCEQNTNKTEDSLWTSLYNEPQVIKHFTKSPVCT